MGILSGQCEVQGCRRDAVYEGWYRVTDFTNNETGLVQKRKVCDLPEHIVMLIGGEKLLKEKEGGKMANNSMVSGMAFAGWPDGEHRAEISVEGSGAKVKFYKQSTKRLGSILELTREDVILILRWMDSLKDGKINPDTDT